MRVLVTGMGGELGTRVANLLEARPGVEVAGVDSDPPRRRIRHAEFFRIDPRDGERVVDLVREFDPTALVHLGVYEPNARTGPTSAIARTETGAAAVFGAVGGCRSLDRIVVRSGIEVYGRGRRHPPCPDESTPPVPTTPFGRALLRTEEVADLAAAARGIPVAHVRMAPVVGSHLASPLGRLLRLPVVPVSLVSNPRFSLLHLDDAADAVVHALDRATRGPVNVTGGGTVTPAGAARIGGRLPLPLIGAQWCLAKIGAELLGAPLPDHVRELLVRGRTADGSLARQLLGLAPTRSTTDVVHELYEWAPVTYLSVVDGDVA